jgi:hypothetical protein
VLKQILAEMQLTNGRSVLEEIVNLETAAYVVGFVPGPNQIRLSETRWRIFVDKLQRLISEDETEG